MKRTKPKPPYNPYDNPRHRMNWGEYDGRRVKRIPAQYFLDLERDGWALPDMLDWISRNRDELVARAEEENRNGYTEKYHSKHAIK